MTDNFWAGFEKKAADELDEATRDHLKSLSSNASRAASRKGNTFGIGTVGGGAGLAAGIAAGKHFIKKKSKGRGPLAAAMMAAGAGAAGYASHKRNKAIDEARGTIFGTSNASPAGE